MKKESSHLNYNRKNTCNAVGIQSLPSDVTDNVIYLACMDETVRNVLLPLVMRLLFSQKRRS